MAYIPIVIFFILGILWYFFFSDFILLTVSLTLVNIKISKLRSYYSFLQFLNNFYCAKTINRFDNALMLHTSFSCILIGTYLYTNNHKSVANTKSPAYFQIKDAIYKISQRTEERISWRTTSRIRREL